MGKRERGSSIKKKRKYLRSSIAILLSVFLAFGNISFPVFAEDDIDVSTATDAEEIEVTEDTEKVEEAATATEAVEETEIAFNESKTVNGVKVTVSADKGVFPKGSSLFVRAVGTAEEASVENAVEEERSDDVKVATSYTFDIKVLDADGNEIQPDTSKGTVKVSFATDEADNVNLTADIYHIDDDMNVDKLDSDTTTEGSKPAVVAETEGFSYYQVEFTYGEMQYVLPGDSEVRLQEILDYLGISGNVTNVYGSNDSLFSAENRDGEWYVIAHQAFSSNEWLKVTLDGVEMDVEILVTDDAVKTYTLKPNGVWDENGNQLLGYVYLNTNDTLKFEGSEGEDVGITIRFYRAFSDYQEKGTYYSGQKTVYELFNEKAVLEVHNGGTPGMYNFGRIITVNLNANGGTLGTTTFEASPSLAYFPNSVEIPTRPGYKFLGYYGTFNDEERMWYDADGKHKWATYLIGDGFTLYAHWEVDSSTVTLNDNGGSGGSGSVTATYNSAMPTPIALPTRTGYTFDGYWDAKSGGTQYYTSTGQSATTWNKAGPQTLYARWTAKTYTVTFDKQSGSGGSDNVTATYNSAMPAMTKPTRTGYTFGGYWDAASGGTQYYKADGSSARTWNKASNTKLYAHWTANKYTVTLNSQNGTGGSTSVEATYGSAMPSANMPTRTGYTFGGYYTETNGGGTQYYNESGGSTSNWNIANATTLYAKWTPITYKVVYNGNKPATASNDVLGTTADSTHTYDTAKDLTSNGFSLVGWTFKGWTHNSNGTGTVYTNGQSVTNLTSTNDATYDLYAKWEANKYTVTLNQNYVGGGSEVVEATYDSDMPTATLPTRDGYVFCGYYDTNAQTGGTQYYKADGTSARTWDKTEATTLYARWKEKAAAITDPTANLNLVYNGSSQALVTTGVTNHESNGTKMQYQLDGGAWGDAVPAPTNAGTYSVKYKPVAVDETLYEDGDESASIEVTIAKAPVKVTPDSGQQKMYGDNDPSFTYTVSPDLFGDDTLAGSLAREAGDDVGTYDFNIGSLNSSNYKITFDPGDPVVKFTIVKRSTPVASVEALDDAQKPTASDLAYTGGELALAVAPTTAVDGYTVLYQLDNGEWTTTIPKATADGAYTLKVKYVADDNHMPFPEGSDILTYTVNITVAATIGENKYGTIEEAVEAWNTNGGELVLQSDATLTSPIVLDTNNDKTLDLNGYKINHESEVFAITVSAGSLTVKDSTGGNGEIVSAGPAIHVVDSGTNVTIESGKITSTNGRAVVVDTGSNLVVAGGAITGKTDGINATGESSIKVTGGNISGNNNAGINLSGNATADVKGGTITSVSGAGIDASDDSAVTISNGTVSSQSGAGIKIRDTADATISGGTVSSTSGVGIDINGFNENKLATLNISGGSISSGDKAGIKAGKYSDVNISGGSVTSENGYGLDSSSTTPLEITGDAYVGGEGVNLGSDSVIDISNGITSQIPIKVTTASADAPITTGGNYEPKMADYKEIIKAFKLENDGSELTIGVDKNVKAMQSSPYGGITVDGIKVSPANIQYLLPGLSASDVTFTPATDEAPAKLVINGDAKIPEGSELIIPEGVEVTISEGVTLDNNGDIVNNGTLINNGTITGSGDIANNGNVDNGGDITTTGTVTNSEAGTINNTGAISSAIENAGELNNAADGTISGAVDNSGELNNAGEISGNITNSETGTVTNDETGVISGAVDNSGELDNSGEISGKLDNEAGGVVNNAEGGKLSGDVTNAEDGTVNNAEGGNISGNIDNSGEVNNSGLIEGDITNAENGVVNNAEGASILGDVDNSGLLENDGYVFGAVTNEANGIINNNADAEIAGTVENKEGGAINNAEDGVISGDVDNAGEINNDGTILGGVNNSGELENNGLLSGDVDNAGLLENNGEVTGAVTNEAGATLNNNADAEISGPVINSKGASINNAKGAVISGDVDNSGELNNSGSIVGDITNNAGGLINNNDGGDISGNTNNKEGAVVINNSGASINANVDNAGTLVNAGGKTNADVNNATNGMVVTIPEDALDEFKLNEDGSMTLPAGTTVLVGDTLNELPEGGSIGSDGKLTINTTPEEATNGSSSDDNSSAKPATVKPGAKNGKKVLGNIKGFRAGAIDDGSEDKPKKKSNVKDKDSDKQDVEEVEDDVEEEVKSQDTDNSDDTNQAKKESKAYVWWIVIGSILIVGLGFFLFLLFKRRKDDDEEKK